jgi:hypothetical protein
MCNWCWCMLWVKKSLPDQTLMMLPPHASIRVGRPIVSQVIPGVGSIFDTPLHRQRLMGCFVCLFDPELCPIYWATWAPCRSVPPFCSKNALTFFRRKQSDIDRQWPRWQEDLAKAKTLATFASIYPVYIALFCLKKSKCINGCKGCRSIHLSGLYRFVSFQKKVSA